MNEYEPGIMVRRATVHDALSIASVLLASFAEYKASYTPEAFAVAAPTSEQVQLRMNEGPVWVVLQHGTIVGTVSAVLKDKAVYLRGMAIIPAARGQRLGMLLLEQVEAFASSQYCERVFLSTIAFLVRAIALYEQCGFRASDEGPHELFGTPLFTMVKILHSGDEE